MSSDAEIENLIKECDQDKIYGLYRKPGLKSRHIDLAMNVCKDYLAVLYKNQKLNAQQINKAIELGINNEEIYTNYSLSSDQVDRAIKKELLFRNELHPESTNVPFEALCQHQKFTDAQIARILKEGSADNVNALVEKLRKK